MSCSARHNALGRHPALNRMPRDFLSTVQWVSPAVPDYSLGKLKGDLT